MTKHLCVPIRRWRKYLWLCIHCGDVFKEQDTEGCSYQQPSSMHDKGKCAERPCACPCGFCRKFPRGDE